MSHYKKDARGEYRVVDRYVDAWEGQAAGWCTCEVREYTGGQTVIHRGEPTYLHETGNSAIHAMHAIYMRAKAELMNEH